MLSYLQQEVCSIYLKQVYPLIALMCLYLLKRTNPKIQVLKIVQSQKGVTHIKTNKIFGHTDLDLGVDSSYMLPTQYK